MMKGKKKFMAIKIDLAKAYDRLNWSFIKNSLVAFGLNNDFIKLIMACISSASHKILWNGTKSESFKPSRGIISFADNLLLFAEASVDQMRIILNYLNIFCEASGQKVNPQKTSILFSKNVTGQEAAQIAGYRGFSISENLGRYLGAHIFSGRSNVNKYRFLADKINSCLSGWKKQCLSLAGRLTLANSVMGTTANFHMQHDKIPKTILLNIEQSQREFIWGSNSNGRKAHLVSWNTLCKP